MPTMLPRVPWSNSLDTLNLSCYNSRNGRLSDVTQHMPELVGWSYGAEELPGRLHAMRYEIDNAVLMRKSNENVHKTGGIYPCPL